MYTLLDKDTIEMEIVPLVEIVNVILYKLKSRCSMESTTSQQSIV